jgi:type III restriction enzyme
MDLFIPTKLKEKVIKWREEGYPCNYPALSEIFNYSLYEDESGNQILRYLRKAQFEALETYWYLRVVEKTPHIFDLYNRLYDNPKEMFSALGITLTSEIWQEIALSGKGPNYIIEKIKTDDDFVKKNKLEVVRESLTLDYPSYILALAMGSGKTILIGSIICTEFSFALEYQNDFVKNALVFAPGKTILGALKEISDISFDKILPSRLYKQFMSSVKITYTQDKEKDIPIIRGSSFNIIVTNTEKIRIQKPTGKGIQLNLLNYKEIEKIEEAQEVANLRLQTIASLPHLAIFSDEAHHTYGQSLDVELKKVRKTVDYLAENTNVIVVVNTTGTPYYKKQMLRDVVFWYGLSQGIKDGILKEVKESIYSYDNIDTNDFVNVIVEDFFKEYKDVKTYNGAKSKLAIYFPQTDDLKKIKPFIEKKVSELGLDPSIVLEVHNKSDEKIKDLFNNRVNDIDNPYRVYLLVNMGTEGWNCPSLFATALARKLKSSNNFVLQAASRCLRQIPNNNKKARIYLSKDNVKVLDSQLKETFGESLQTLDMTKQEMRKERLVLRKTEIPPILIKKKIKKIILDETHNKKLDLEKPNVKSESSTKTQYNLRERMEKYGVLIEDKVEKIIIDEDSCDIYEVAIDLSQIYRLDLDKVYSILKKLYSDNEIPLIHIIELKKQIEQQTKKYKITEEEIEVHLALVKKDGFNREEENGNVIYTTEIIYHKDKENLLLHYEKFKNINNKDFSFHYSPYKMDSNPEKDFFIQLIESLNENPDNIEDIYFTGQLTDSKKTDFLFEYKDKKGKWRSYTPDFVIKKKDGKILIVEVKGEVFRDENKEMAIRELENLNPDNLKYEVLLTKDEEIGFDNIQKVKNWIYGE